ncbi:hypothetical protein N7457_009611 [Penicillium paradoxum]|uniref:uncharacterized protein n=1 Tax=Penicillium paradoxum TaxID=176176 RepID=UPI002548C127|nr:uncharacterized protein N7457_009611 [Penicillium paradoxum]KAJ5774715.1 hypothetical protein N7457_009611 [Penicillium paradoxum]
MPPLDNQANIPQDFPAHSHQQFRCQFPGCNASYRRKEHVRRHELKHFPRQAFPCSSCGREFGRRYWNVIISDTLRRHVQKHHKRIDPLNRAQRACENCHKRKSRCEGGVPCDECLRRKIQCSFRDHDSTTEGNFPESPANQVSGLVHEPSQMHNLGKREQCINLYFEKFHPQWPFIHKGSFDMRQETPLLVQSMIVIGLWARGDQPAQSAAVELHGKLDSAIQDQREKWDVPEGFDDCSACSLPIATYQAILLHIIFSCILRSRDTMGFDLKIRLSTGDFSLLEALVRSCRKLGMFCYPKILARYKETDLEPFVWVSIEEIKWFNVALYKICGKSSRSSEGEGRYDTDAVIPLLNARELQFPLPKNCPLWNAVNKEEWISLGKDEDIVCMNDHVQEDWISNSAGLLRFLEV